MFFRKDVPKSGGLDRGPSHRLKTDWYYDNRGATRATRAEGQHAFRIGHTACSPHSIDILLESLYYALCLVSVWKYVLKCHSHSPTERALSVQ